MDLPILTNPGPKPPIHIYVDEVTTRVLDAQVLNIQDLQVNTLETKGDVKVGGFFNSENISAGMSFLSASSTTVAGVALSQPGFLVYNPFLKKVTASSSPAVGTYEDSLNGATWSALTLPIANLSINYSPDLNLYSATEQGGSAVYTSTTGATGSWSVQAPASFTFNGQTQFYSTRLQRYFADTTDAGQVVCYSNDGINYTKVPSNRQTLFGYADSDDLKLIVTVGDHGPMWSPDGISWTNSLQTYSMSSVCYSPFWKMFVALPRLSNLRSVYTSTDGKTWVQNATAFPVGFSENLRTITWSQQWGVFIGAGDNDTLVISQDGASWRQIQVGVGPMDNYGSIYIDQWGCFIFVGNAAVIRVTPKLFV